jgi:hypothetical protein
MDHVLIAKLKELEEVPLEVIAFLTASVGLLLDESMSVYNIYQVEHVLVEHNSGYFSCLDISEKNDAAKYVVVFVLSNFEALFLSF